MVNAASNKLDDMMRKVRGLLAKADDPAASPQEADSCRMMAEKIMRKYKIEEEHLRESGALIGDQFNVMFTKIGVYNVTSVFSSTYTALIAYAANHCGVRLVWDYGYEDGERMLWLIGYESDIRYCESLFTQARLLFAARMEPKVDPNLSDMDNVYNLRSSGLERRKVAEMMGWVKGGAKVTRLYKQACEARGEEPVLTGQGQNLEDYRVMYATHFQNTFWSNLNRARMAVDAEVDGGLVLHGRAERVEEAMYQRWPHLRPDPVPATTGHKPVKAPKYRGPSQADLRKAARRQSGAGAAGAMAGRRAASEININGQTPKRRLGE